MVQGSHGARAQLMVMEWNKSMSMEATLVKLVTADVMAEPQSADGGRQTVRAIQTLVLAKS
jgi:hypothetical protein